MQSIKPSALLGITRHSMESRKGLWVLETPRSLEPVVVTLLILGPRQHPSHLAGPNFSACTGLGSRLQPSQHPYPSLHP